MKKGFVVNQNYVNFRNALKAVEERGTEESCLLLVTGDPGLGKTRAVDRWASEVNAMYVRVSSVTNAKGLMQALASTDPSLPQKGSALQIQQGIIRLLGKTRRPLIIDEVQHLANGAGKMLEAIRDITDVAKGLTVLVAGDPGTQAKIDELPQIKQRIANTIKFEPLTVEDVAKAVRAMADIEIDDALCAELHKQSRGTMRLLINGLAELEQFARTSQVQALTRAQVGNYVMCYEYSPTPVSAKGAKK